MLKSTALFTVLLACTSSVFAQNIKPGLWEIQHRMGGNPQMDQAMAAMQKQMAGLSPAQRKQMESMLGQQGMTLPAPGAGGGMTMKVCITPEMASRQEMPSQTEGECTSTITARSANTLKMSFVCKSPPSLGEATYTFKGDTAYTMKTTMTTTQPGKPESMTMDGQGKWLSSDCGGVKPVQVPAR